MSKKWYNYFVSVDPVTGEPSSGGETGEGTTPAGGASAADQIAGIAQSMKPAVAFANPVANPASFAQIYDAAEVPTPAHGFTIFKIAEMLKNEHMQPAGGDQAQFGAAGAGCGRHQVAGSDRRRHPSRPRARHVRGRAAARP